jgi:hypothetical protein
MRYGCETGGIAHFCLRGLPIENVGQKQLTTLGN